MKTQHVCSHYFQIPDLDDPVIDYILIDTKHRRRECCICIRQSTANFLNAASWMQLHHLKYVEKLPAGYSW